MEEEILKVSKVEEVIIEKELVNYLAELLLEKPKSPEMVVAIAKLYEVVWKCS